MKNNYIYKHIRISGLFSVILSVVMLLLIYIIADNIDFTEVFAPSDISSAGKAYQNYMSGNEYVNVTLNNVHYTGYDCYHHGNIYASYYYSLSGNSCTLILLENKNGRLPEELDNYHITARLVKSDKLTDTVIDMLAKDLSWTSDGLKSITSSVIIDETAYRYHLYLYLAIALGIILLIISSYLISNLIYILIPAVHPACIYFRRLSKEKKTITHVNKELYTGIIIKSGNIMLTEHYIVCASLFNIDIIPINKIIWAYEHSTWQHFLWFKIKLNYTLSILYGHRIHIDSPRNTKEDIDTIINHLKSYYPNIIFDYTLENKIAAKKRADTITKQNKLKKKIQTKRDRKPF